MQMYLLFRKTPNPCTSRTFSPHHAIPPHSLHQISQLMRFLFRVQNVRHFWQQQSVTGLAEEEAGRKYLSYFSSCVYEGCFPARQMG